MKNIYKVSSNSNSGPIDKSSLRFIKIDNENIVNDKDIGNKNSKNIKNIIGQGGGRIIMKLPYLQNLQTIKIKSKKIKLNHFKLNSYSKTNPSKPFSAFNSKGSLTVPYITVVDKLTKPTTPTKSTHNRLTKQTKSTSSILNKLKSITLNPLLNKQKQSTPNSSMLKVISRVKSILSLKPLYIIYI